MDINSSETAEINCSNKSFTNLNVTEKINTQNKQVKTLGNLKWMMRYIQQIDDACHLRIKLQTLVAKKKKSIRNISVRNVNSFKN